MDDDDDDDKPSSCTLLPTTAVYKQVRTVGGSSMWNVRFSENSLSKKI